ncbi:MAG: hypothetical protein IJF02_06355 [Oscillospiraceae bacterium]|nr:hypothetical protein [Oscillospiraceae bacterium]
MNITIIISLVAIVVLFIISFTIVTNYNNWTKNKKTKFVSHSRILLNTISPNNNSKPLSDFVRFLDEEKPKGYTLKGNKYE